METVADLLILSPKNILIIPGALWLFSGRGAWRTEVRLIMEESEAFVAFLAFCGL